MMKTKVFLTCAVNGSGDTASKHPDLPKTPKQIAKSALESAKAEHRLFIFMSERKMEHLVENLNFIRK